MAIIDRTTECEECGRELWGMRFCEDSDACADRVADREDSDPEGSHCMFAACACAGRYHDTVGSLRAGLRAEERARADW